MYRWFQRAVTAQGYIVTDVTIPGVPGRIKVYHDGNLDQDRIRKLYAEVKGIELLKKVEVTKTLLLKEKLKSVIKEAHKLCDSLLNGDYSVIPSKYLQAEAETVASVKFFLTIADKTALRDLGYRDAEIQAMKPDEGAAIIAAKKVKTQAN